MLYEPGYSCEICGKDGPHSSCKMCGAVVCGSCIDEDEGVCINCQESRCQVCGEFLASRACNTCGKLVCEEHGIKINEVTSCDSCRKSVE